VPTAVEQAQATIEADFAPAAGANEPLREIAASVDEQATSPPAATVSVKRGENR